MRLEELRVAAGLSQEALARSANVSRTYLSDLERGQKEAGVEVLVRLAGALSVEPGALLGGVALGAAASNPRPRLGRLTPAGRLGRQVARLAEGADEDALRRFVSVARAFFPAKGKKLAKGKK